MPFDVSVVIGPVLKCIEWVKELWAQKKGKQRETLKIRVLMEMRQTQSKNPAPLIFSVDNLSGLTGIPVDELLSVLDELEHEGRIFYSSVGFSGYSLHRMPWERPRVYP